MRGRMSAAKPLNSPCGPAQLRGVVRNCSAGGTLRPPWRRQSGLTWLLTWLLTWALGGWSCVAGWTLASARAEEPAVTFFATSDSHYEALEKLERNDRNRVTLRRMNELPGQPWPDALGGDPIDKPRGVLVLGDLIDDGDRQGQTEIEWNHFENQFGLDGSDGLLKFPVFEGWGNHDGPPAAAIKHGFSVQQQIRQRNLRRLDQKLISHVAPNQLHYSWDWNGVHFIQANLYPADRQHPKVRYSLPWHDPQLALQFVREDLAAHVGDSGRPVIIMAHCGFDTDWWVADDWNAFHEAIAPYNVVAYFHGHSGTGIRKWQPAEGGRPLQVVNTGQTEKGFFVAQVSSTRLRVAFQVKRNAAELDKVEWDWKYLLDLPLVPKGATPPAADSSGAESPATSPKSNKPAAPRPTPPAPAAAPAEKRSAAPSPVPAFRPAAPGAPPATAKAATPQRRDSSASDRPTADGELVFRVAVIGDFGFDKTVVKPAPQAPVPHTGVAPSKAESAPASDRAAPCPAPQPTPQPPQTAPPTPASSTAAQPTNAQPTNTSHTTNADDSHAAAAGDADSYKPPAKPLAAAQVARLVDSWRPDFVITTGDNNYPRGEASTIDWNIGRHYAHYIGDYRGQFGPGSETNRFFPVLGNHDWDAPRIGCQAYLDYFTLPGNERYYDFVSGPVHFLCLDSDGHEPDGNRVGSTQHQWFSRVARESPAAIQVVIMHHPPYSSGSHGGVTSSQWNFAELGIDLVLSGHDHNYERIERDGVLFVINGAGGASLRPFKKPVEGSQARHHTSHGALRLEARVHAGEAHLAASFLDVSGRSIDTFEIVRPLPATPAPAAPATPAAESDSGRAGSCGRRPQ